MPGLFYGADITGVSDSMLRQQRSVISRMVCAPTAWKNPMVALWIMDCEGNKTDPTFTVHEMPISQYAIACYEKWFPSDIQQTTFSRTVEAIDKANHQWSMVKGPIAATILSARRFGWTLHSAHTITTDSRTLLDFTLDSHSFVSQMATEAVRRSIARGTFPYT